MGLGSMGNPCEIKLKNYAKPFATTMPRKIPFPLWNQTKSKIERMLKCGVIEPIEETMEWCAQMVVVPKKNNQVQQECETTILPHFPHQLYYGTDLGCISFF